MILRVYHPGLHSRFWRCRVGVFRLHGESVFFRRVPSVGYVSIVGLRSYCKNESVFEAGFMSVAEMLWVVEHGRRGLRGHVRHRDCRQWNQFRRVLLQHATQARNSCSDIEGFGIFSQDIATVVSLLKATTFQNSRTTHAVSCNMAEVDCLSPHMWYGPGYVSPRSGCCHCEASCANTSGNCTYYDAVEDPQDSCAPTNPSIIQSSSKLQIDRRLHNI